MIFAFHRGFEAAAGRYAYFTWVFGGEGDPITDGIPPLGGLRSLAGLQSVAGLRALAGLRDYS